MEEAVESLFRALKYTGEQTHSPLERGGLWFSQFDDDHFSLTTIGSCFLEADPRRS